ncbi:MAG: ATP-binding protein, partial [Thermodesulfovibrionales bacterium]|nr:ATP-binding protein [Thermodesulfovibrionales bacterium]
MAVVEEGGKMTYDNEKRLESLLRIIQFKTDDIKEFLDYALHEAIQLTDSKYGYIYYYNEDTKEFTLNTWSKDVMKECSIIEPKTRYHLDKTGIWGEVVRQRSPIIVNHFQSPHHLKRGYPKGHVELTRFLTVPVIVEDRIEAVIGVANKESEYNDTDVRQLILLLDSVWNVSNRKKREQELQIAKDKAEAANRAKSVFLSNISHEMRTPLNVILGMTTLLLNTKTEQEKNDYLMTIKTSAETLLNIINDLLDITKIEDNKLELNETIFDLKSLITDCNYMFSSLAETKGLTFETTIDANIPLILKGDRIRLRQILDNLIGNAIKFTEKGKVTLNVKLKELIDNKEAVLQFSVSDTGIGMPQDKLKHVFDRFMQVDDSSTRRFGGTGLGLAISKELVKMMEGDIWVSSELGKGSVFNFTVKLRIFEDNKAYEKVENDNNLSITTGKSLNILLVEDNKLNQKVASLLLEKLGHSVTIVEDGSQAIDILKDRNFDLIFMDVHMPVMDGIE